MRRLSLFALIFIVLGGLYWFLEVPKGKDSDREPAYLIANFSPEKVQRINISRSGPSAIVLKRTNNGWQVAADQKTFYAAEISAIEALFDSLTNLKTGSMVSHNPERHALYEVNSKTGVRVETLGPEGTLTNVIIGKNGPNIFSTYIRLADSDEVFLVDGILQGAVSKSLNEWRDKRIFSLEPEDVSAYSVNGERSLSLRKNENIWLAGPDDTPVDSGSAAKLMHSFANLRAVDFAEGPLEEFGLDEPLQTITAEFDNNTQATLLTGKDANAFQQYVKTSDKETIYIIEKHLLSLLCPTIEDLTGSEDEEPAESAGAQTTP